VLAEPDDMLDKGPRPGASGRERMCVASRAVRPIDEMIRFVAGPDRRIVPDVKRKLPGRGAWVTARRTLVAKAVKTGALRRAFKDRATVDADLPATVERLLVQSVLDALAIAHKAGETVSGYYKVENALTSGAATALIHASDASRDGVRKIAGVAARRPRADETTLPVIDAFDSIDLDLALGRTNVIHAALVPGRASGAVLGRWHMLEQYRESGSDVGSAERAAVPSA
jgi:predicted RNA-binding protein YlxR (DUF448 family)